SKRRWPMPMTVQCPACGKKAKVPDGYLGQTARCPSCNGRFRIGVSGDGSGSVAGARAPAAKATPPSSVLLADPSPPTPPVPATSLPAQIGRYQVLDALGAGNFGAVYRAYDPQLEREVALKVPHADTLENPRAVERFLREAKAAARLRHPHIVPVF